jgi:hypothetical protein
MRPGEGNGLNRDFLPESASPSKGFAATHFNLSVARQSHIEAYWNMKQKRKVFLCAHMKTSSQI